MPIRACQFSCHDPLTEVSLPPPRRADLGFAGPERLRRLGRRKRRTVAVDFGAQLWAHSCLTDARRDRLQSLQSGLFPEQF